ncbi:MAG: ADP-ribosylglycohydrolase family protein [Acidobacteria bacterium]|nr:ADP-ribosylglycohydrolase family protein [Acidobacteriota bacterium]
MLGAIAGDIIGSCYEGKPLKSTHFPLFSKHSRFTDDTVLTLAVAHSILKKLPYEISIKNFARAYPDAGYGGTFFQWMLSQDNQPYNSWGNGSAMRVSPVGFAFNTIEEVLAEAKKSAEVTHNHPEGIKGAQATAVAVFLARNGSSKSEIKEYISNNFQYNLDRTLAEIRPSYSFDVSCQGSVPESIISFLESDNYKSAVKNAISLGGDADTMACISGAIAQAYYKEIPEELVTKTRELLTEDLLEVLDQFNSKFNL